MANRYAVATGNWSDTATWDGGTLPTAGDVVRPNGFTVTIDIDVTVDELTNYASAPAVAGGSFVLNSSVTLNANTVRSLGAADTILYSGAGSSIINSDIIINAGGGTTIDQTVNHSGSGILTINGDVLTSGQSSNRDSNGITITGTGTLNVNGYIEGDSNATNYNRTNAGIRVSNNAATVNVVGTVKGGPQSGGASVLNLNVGINIDSSATINVVGIVEGGPTDIRCVGILCSTGNPSITVEGSISASNFACAIQGTNVINLLIDANVVNTEFSAIFTRGYKIKTTSEAVFQHQTETIGVNKFLYTAGSLTGYPLEAKVEDGTVYGPSSEFEGTLVPVTVTVDVQQLANDLAPLIQVDTQQLATDFLDEVAVSPDPLAERLRNVATVQSTGAQIASIP